MLRSCSCPVVASVFTGTILCALFACAAWAAPAPVASGPPALAPTLEGGEFTAQSALPRPRLESLFHGIDLWRHGSIDPGQYSPDGSTSSRPSLNLQQLSFGSATASAAVDDEPGAALADEVSLRTTWGKGSLSWGDLHEPSGLSGLLDRSIRGVEIGDRSGAGSLSMLAGQSRLQKRRVSFPVAYGPGPYPLNAAGPVLARSVRVYFDGEPLGESDYRFDPASDRLWLSDGSMAEGAPLMIEYEERAAGGTPSATVTGVQLQPGHSLTRISAFAFQRRAGNDAGGVITEGPFTLGSASPVVRLLRGPVSEVLEVLCDGSPLLRELEWNSSPDNRFVIIRRATPPGALVFVRYRVAPSPRDRGSRGSPTEAVGLSHQSGSTAWDVWSSQRAAAVDFKSTAGRVATELRLRQGSETTARERITARLKGGLLSADLNQAASDTSLRVRGKIGSSTGPRLGWSWLADPGRGERRREIEIGIDRPRIQLSGKWFDDASAAFVDGNINTAPTNAALRSHGWGMHAAVSSGQGMEASLAAQRQSGSDFSTSSWVQASFRSDPTRLWAVQVDGLSASRGAAPTMRSDASTAVWLTASQFVLDDSAARLSAVGTPSSGSYRHLRFRATYRSSASSLFELYAASSGGNESSELPSQAQAEGLNWSSSKSAAGGLLQTSAGAAWSRVLYPGPTPLAVRTAVCSARLELSDTGAWEILSSGSFSPWSSSQTQRNAPPSRSGGFSLTVSHPLPMALLGFAGCNGRWCSGNRGYAYSAFYAGLAHEFAAGISLRVRLQRSRLSGPGAPNSYHADLASISIGN